MEPQTISQNQELHGRITDSLIKLSACARSLRLYGRGHPLIAEMIDAAHFSLLQTLAVEPVISLCATEHHLALNSFPIDDQSGTLQSIATALYERQVAELRITYGVQSQEVEEFAEILCVEPESLTLRGGIENELRSRGVLHIQTFSQASGEERVNTEAARIYDGALIMAEEAMKAVESGLPLPVSDIRATVAQSLQSLISDETALLALAAIRSYDKYLSEHSVNVCIFSMMLGRDLGLEHEAAMDLGISALLHDVGKVFIPGEIVKKPGKLTEEEWEQIRRHPLAGAKALAGMKGIPPLAATICLEHHMYADGSGYPNISADHRPHLLSRLVTIADTYDAMTTDRPYRERWTPEQTIAWMMYETAHKYDKQLLFRFASRAGLYPPGTLVRLNSGDLATVVSGSQKNPDHLKLQIIRSGNRKQKNQIVDLAEHENRALKIDQIAQPVEALRPYVEKLSAA